MLYSLLFFMIALSSPFINMSTIPPSLYNLRKRAKYGSSTNPLKTVISWTGTSRPKSASMANLMLPVDRTEFSHKMTNLQIFTSSASSKAGNLFQAPVDMQWEHKATMEWARTSNLWQIKTLDGLIRIEMEKLDSGLETSSKKFTKSTFVYHFQKLSRLVWSRGDSIAKLVACLFQEHQGGGLEGGPPIKGRYNNKN